MEEWELWPPAIVLQGHYLLGKTANYLYFIKCTKMHLRYTCYYHINIGEWLENPHIIDDLIGIDDVVINEPYINVLLEHPLPTPTQVKLCCYEGFTLRGLIERIVSLYQTICDPNSTHPLRTSYELDFGKELLQKLKLSSFDYSSIHKLLFIGI